MKGNNIPLDLRAQLEADPYYKHCAISLVMGPKIDWHHNLIYAGRQVQARFCIIPLSNVVHEEIVFHKEEVDWIMVNRATDEELVHYSKVIDYLRMRDVLNQKYGEYKEPVYR